MKEILAKNKDLFTVGDKSFICFGTGISPLALFRDFWLYISVYKQ